MLIWKVLQPAKRGGKRSGRGRTKLKTQHSFSRINAQSAMLCQWWWIVGNIFSYCNFNRNRLWPLNLLSLVLNPFTIYLWTIFSLQCKLWINFPLFQSGKRDLSLLDIIAAQKQHLNYKNNLSSFQKELV